MGAFEMDNVLKDADEGKKIFGELYTEFEEVVKELPEEQVSPFFEMDLEEVTKALPADLGNAIKEVSTWMKRMAGMKGAPGPAIARVLTFLGKVVGGRYPYPKPVGKAEDVPSTEEAKKALPADLATAIKRVVSFLNKVAGGRYPYPKPVGKAEDFEKEVPAELATALKSIEEFLTKALEGEYPWPKPEASAGEEKPPAKKPTKKDEPAETPAVAVMDDGTVIVKGQPVAKGKKFTASRINALKDTVLQTLKLLGEVADDSTRKALTEALKLFEGDGTPTQKNDPEPDPAKEELLKTVAELQKRLDEIEKTRGAGAPTDDKTMTKKEPGFWDSIVATPRS